MTVSSPEILLKEMDNISFAKPSVSWFWLLSWKGSKKWDDTDIHLSIYRTTLLPPDCLPGDLMFGGSNRYYLAVGYDYNIWLWRVSVCGD